MEPGTLVAGKYRVERVLGKGGMGVVVAATHIHLGTVSALKFLHDDAVADKNVVARFLREARACAQLRSEHVCRVTDFGLEGHVPYIVMEMLEGSDLSRLLRAGPLDVATAADYVMQACAGLAEAHALGIVHRDLKPGNLFLSRRPDGSAIVKVLDFGVAKAPDGVDLNLTTTGAIVGSPGYMSPEQLRASRVVDARSDVWALGIILYKMTTGRQPFKAEQITDLAISITIDPPPPLVEVPPAFAAVVMRCLEKDPAARYASVQELTAALTPFTLEQRATTNFAMVDVGPTSAMGAVDPPTTLGRASGAIVQAPEAPRRASWPIVAGVAVVVLVAGLVTVSQLGGAGPAAKPPAPPVAAPLAPVAPAPAAAAPPVVAIDAGVPDAAPRVPDAAVAVDAAVPPPPDAAVPHVRLPPPPPPQQPKKKAVGDDIDFIQPGK